MSDFHLQDHLEKLIHFESSARLGKISSAASALRVSPAAISRSIKILEESLERQLIVRRQAGIDLTEEGKTLFEYAKRLLEDAASIEEKIRGSSSDRLLSTLRVGTHEALAIHYWPEALKAFLKSNPNVKVSLTSGRVDELVAGLMNRHFDVIVSVAPSGLGELDSKVLYKTKLGLFAGHQEQYKYTYPFFRHATLDLDSLNRLPILTDLRANPQQGVTMRQLLVKWGFDLRNIFELNSFEAAIRLAINGVGIAVLPEQTAKRDVQSGRLRKIKLRGKAAGTFGQHTINLSTLKGRMQDSPIFELFEVLSRFR